MLRKVKKSSGHTRRIFFWITCCILKSSCCRYNMSASVARAADGGALSCFFPSEASAVGGWYHQWYNHARKHTHIRTMIITRHSFNNKSHVLVVNNDIKRIVMNGHFLEDKNIIGFNIAWATKIVKLNAVMQYIQNIFTWKKLHLFYPSFADPFTRATQIIMLYKCIGSVCNSQKASPTFKIHEKIAKHTGSIFLCMKLQVKPDIFTTFIRWGPGYCMRNSGNDYNPSGEGETD